MVDTPIPDFEETYSVYQPAILRYLSRLAGEAEAEDLAQEVFVKVAVGLGDFRGECKLSTWLYRIATNVALDRMRSPSFRHAVQEDCHSGPMDEVETQLDDRNVWTGEKTAQVEPQVYRSELNACIRDFVARLPQEYRAVLVLSELDGIRDTEIAEILQVSLGTVKIRLHRARERLKAELAGKCDSYWVEGNEFLPELKGPEKKKN
jgi:RNA polymerase sigma-70 factor (ECF subfamily)